MSKTVLVPIADGCEEIEAVCIIDVLRRAGAEVTVAAVPAAGAPVTTDAPLQISASRGVTLLADTTLSACRDDRYDLIALPGGLPGAEHLRDCAPLIEQLQRQAADGRWYAAICAAPAIALQPHGLLAGRRATCYPTFRNQLDPDSWCNEDVVVDANCVTSQGPATALEFALALVEVLYGKEKRAETARPMLVR